MYKTPPKTSSAPSPIRNILASQFVPATHKNGDSKPSRLNSFRRYTASVDTIRATRPRNEKDHRSDRWSQKPQRLFVGNCLALRRQLTARRLAGCCRVDARFTLAFRTLASGRWPLDLGPVGHRSPSALVAFGARRFRARDGARNRLDQPPKIQQRI